MDFRQISVFFLFVGAITVLIGLADITVTVVIRRTHRVGNGLIGVTFVVLGFLMLWLTQQGNSGKQISPGPVLNKISGWLPLLLGIGAFVLRTAMSIRDGLLRLQAGNISRFEVWTSRFQIVFGIVFIVFLIGVLAWFIVRATGSA